MSDSQSNISEKENIYTCTTTLKKYRMVFRAGLRDPCTRDVAMDSPAARVFLRFPKVEQHPKCMDHAILLGKPFGNCFIK
jgi:hypothetical protein